MTALEEPISTPNPAVPPPPAPVPLVGEKPTTKLVADIAEEAGSLLTDTANLFQAELREGAKQTSGWVVAAIAGAGLVAVGVLFALISGVYGLNEGTHLPLWACWLIVGGSMLVVGGVLAFLGINHLTRVNMIPTRTLKSLSETWSWLVKRSSK